MLFRKLFTLTQILATVSLVALTACNEKKEETKPMESAPPAAQEAPAETAPAQPESDATEHQE